MFFFAKNLSTKQQKRKYCIITAKLAVAFTSANLWDQGRNRFSAAQNPQ